mgnify:CR=1 FL=1
MLQNKKFIIYVLLFIYFSCGWSGPNYNMILIHHLFEVAEDYNTTSNTGVSDVWGYTDETGIEYAIVGYCYGTFIYDVSSNPDSPTLVADIPGPSSGDYYFHRDYKTFGNYLYIVNEMSGADQGMQIVDLSPLPNDAPIQIETYTGINKSHNLWIDESSGYGFIEKSHPENIHIVDLSSPAVPVHVGGFWNSDGQGCHDIYTENNMAYISEGSDFSIYDISNISDPLLVTTIPSFGYAHNAWLNSAGTHLITGEETVGMTLKIWDIQQIENINMVGEYLGENSLVHNVHVKGDFVFISHYTTGLKIIDIFNPTDPIEVAAYDTYPDDDNPGFYGCWGAYPFTLNNYVFASDIQYGLFVFEFDNIKAGWIYGNIAAWTTNGGVPVAGIELKSLLLHVLL